ncbi:hypothetical protein [Haloarcula halophila]|uniref:hypothetical protein n=1 Tax=Haloarcula TaxID=2237 RepID=UPI0023E38D65|nr:hypothetical protein [Halomicroarcula sp. DFY41]
MSLTPLDERQRNRHETARDGASAESLWSRLRARAGDVLARLPLTRRLFGATDESTTETAALSRADPSAHTTRFAVDDLLQRETPLVMPARGDASENPVELDVTEHADRLTLSLGANPEATITSDTYWTVEP